MGWPMNGYNTGAYAMVQGYHLAPFISFLHVRSSNVGQLQKRVPLSGDPF